VSGVLIPDVNMVVHAYDLDSHGHDRARRWWETTLQQPRPVGIPWVSSLGFIRIATHRGILTSPLAVRDAIGHVREWPHHPRVRIVTPGDRHAEVLFELLAELGTRQPHHGCASRRAGHRIPG
jgi:toxin-antitoxin system PIN domain toxin